MVDPIVPVEWLEQNRASVYVCDVRASLSGGNPRADFEEGHLPGAVWIDLEHDLADPPRPVQGRHPLPSARRFAESLGAAGVADDAVVVAYDTSGGAFASRLVWMLRTIGQEAALLDGGLGAWRGELEIGPAAGVAVQRSVVPWPEHEMVDADEVTTHLAEGGVVVDSRGAARFRGEVEPIDPVAGHVPGAVNLPFEDNLLDGAFRSRSDLAARFEAAGVDGDAIVYCGSGVTACHNILAVEATGRGRPRLYVGSWSGWSTDPDRAIATGDT